MAILSILIGGLAGFASFLLALTVFDIGLLGAFSFYVGVGTGTSIALMCTGLFVQWCAAMPQEAIFQPRIRSKTDAIAEWDLDTLAEREVAEHIRERSRSSKVA